MLCLALLGLGVFGEHVSLKGGGGVFHPRIYYLVCKPKGLKFGIHLKMAKIYHKKQYSTWQTVTSV